MSSLQKEADKRKKTALMLLWTGILFISTSIILFFLIFGQVLKEEVKYDLQKAVSKAQPEATISPVNDAFGIVIPKIGANAPIIQNVDPYNEKEYQVALTKGIAHAKNSSLPEHANKGIVFLFAHSAGNFYEANRYNAIFYLLNKLEKKDPIYVFYNEKKYIYYVTETKIVDENQVQYITSDEQKEQLILMTCWPAGTSLKRLLVFAQP
jgi:sortase A